MPAAQRHLAALDCRHVDTHTRHQSKSLLGGLGANDPVVHAVSIPTRRLPDLGKAAETIQADATCEGSETQHEWPIFFSCLANVVTGRS